MNCPLAFSQLSVCVLTSILTAFSVFGPCFTVDRGKNVSHFLFFAPLMAGYIVTLQDDVYKKMSRMRVCVSVVLW